MNLGDTKVDLVKLGLPRADEVYMTGELQSKICRWLRKGSLKMLLYIRHHPLSQLIAYISLQVYSAKLVKNYEGGLLEGKVKIEIHESKVEKFRKQYHKKVWFHTQELK